MAGDKQEAGIARRVRAIRERNGLSREELAVHCGLSWSAIAQIETGRRTNVRPSSLSALAGALGVSADYLLGRAGQSDLLEHHVLVYDGEEDFAATAVPFLQGGVDRDEPTLAVTSERNIELLRGALGRSDAKQVRFADATGWYTEPAAALAAYRRFANDALDRGALWVRVLGEPVWSGRSEADIKFWTRYEALINLAFAGLPLTVVCPYDAAVLDPAIVEHGCSVHASYARPDGPDPNTDYVEPGEYILEGQAGAS